MPLEVKDLKITLSSGEIIADNISFQIEKGQMLSIVGSSGAGKTTVCKAIMGLLGANDKIEGKIMFQGENLLTLPKKKQRQIYGKEICFIMQNPMTAFNPSIRIGKQLGKTYLRHHDKVPKAELLAQFESTLKRLGLEDTKRILKNYPFALSGGMLQRIMIAAALINQPQMLVADEATTAIDACNKMVLMKQLRKFCEEGMSVLLVTHDLKAASVSDQILVMNQGKAIETGKTEAVLRNPKEEYTKYLLNSSSLKRGRGS